MCDFVNINVAWTELAFYYSRKRTQNVFYYSINSLMYQQLLALWKHKEMLFFNVSRKKSVFWAMSYYVGDVKRSIEDLLQHLRPYISQ